MVRRNEDPGRPYGTARRHRLRPVGHSVEHDRDPSVATESPCAITPRQVAALRLLTEGCSLEEIASVMEVRPITVRNHIQAAMDRLGARTRLEAVLAAINRGLL